ncbi:MAG: FAD-dependent oxidoreductase [Thermoplasmata archaeon]
MDRFEVIVIGAGPAGSSAAYSLAREGLSVLLVERGKYPGSKNVFGGRIYTYPLKWLFPKDWREAPIERFVVQENLSLLSEDNAVTIQYDSPRTGSSRVNSFTAIRSKFDRWLAEKAEDKGALLITGTRVDDLLISNGTVYGVRAGDDEVKANVVIAADGVASVFTQKAGIRAELVPKEISIGAKETIKLTKKRIEDRFNVGDKEGVANAYVGQATNFLRGGGFLYTNEDSISLGVVVQAEDLSLHRTEIHDLMERFRLHRSIQKFIQGGKVVEYSAHMIPELGIHMVPRPYANGFLAVGDAAGLVLNHGYTYRGVDLAILSGMASAETVKIARASGDYSARTLSRYLDHLRSFGVLRELEEFRRMPAFLRNPRMYGAYPQLLCNILRRMYTVDGERKEKIFHIMKEEMKGKISLVQLMRDLFGGTRSI